MLPAYDRGRSFTKFTNPFQRCVCVVVIIVGEFLALDLPGLRAAVGRGTKRQIKRSVLVWIVTIAQRGGKLAADRQRSRSRLSLLSKGEPTRDHAVVGCRCHITLGRPPTTDERRVGKTRV